MNPCSWFDQEWMFGVSGGFDIAIANPPYETSRSEGINNSLKDYLQSNYETAEDKFDYYTFFIEKSSKLANTSGNVCLITPDTYLTKPLSRKIRKYLLYKTEIVSIDDFNKGLVFDSVVPTAILLFRNHAHSDNHNMNLKYNISSVTDFLDLVYTQRYSLQKTYIREPDYRINLCADQWFFEFFDSLSNKQNIIKLGELAEIYNGIQTGSDKKYVSYEKKTIQWQKVITGSDIQSYYIRWGGKYVYYVPEVLHSNTRKDIFKTPVKIIIRQTADRIIGAYDDEGFLSMASTFIVKQFKELLPYKALLAILNSNLFLYLYRNINNEEGRVLPQIKKMHIFALPIKFEFPDKPIIDLVDQILDITKDEDSRSNVAKQAKVKELEAQIDLLVYELYELTPEEKAVVEGKQQK